MELEQRYANASIIEAIIDLKVESSPDVDINSLREIQGEVEFDYPIHREIVVTTGEFQAGPNPTATTSSDSVGHAFSSSDGKLIFQARLDGFSFSQLAPYDTWMTLQSEAHRLWEIYRSIAKPKCIKRVSVRYVNRLDLPVSSSGDLDFKDYLKTVPEISPDLNQGLSNYFMQLHIPQEDLQANLILNEAIFPQERHDVVSVLLDLDLSRLIELSSDGDEVWKLLEKFRRRKNKIFEACITDKTREILK